VDQGRPVPFIGEVAEHPTEGKTCAVEADEQVIVTLEGDNSAQSFGRFVSSTDPFTLWFLAQANEIHGIDLTQAASGPMPELAVDSAGGRRST